MGFSVLSTQCMKDPLCLVAVANIVIRIHKFFSVAYVGGLAIAVSRSIEIKPGERKCLLI